MEKMILQLAKRRSRFLGVFCIALLAAIALFAACERPEPEPEPDPTPPVVDTDTLPANKFIGTWVLCGQSSSDEEPPCACTNNLTSIDTIVFTADNVLTIRHGSESVTFVYDCTPSFLIFYETNQQLRPNRVVYSFRMDDTELKITGTLANIPGSNPTTTSCVVRIDTSTEAHAVDPEVPAVNRYLGTWVSRCWTLDMNEDPDYNCTDSWPGDTLVFTENTMIQKKQGGGVMENGYEYTNTCSYLVYFRENLGYHMPNYINKTKFINDTVFFIYSWEYPAYAPTEGQFYNVSFRKIQ